MGRTCGKPGSRRELNARESDRALGTESKSAPPRKGRKCKLMPGGEPWAVQTCER